MVEVFDTFGQPIVSWVTIGAYWGEVEPLQGRELEAAKQVKAQATVKIKTRWLGSGVLMGPENRMVLGDRFAGTAIVTNGLSTVTFSQSQAIAINSWIMVPSDSTMTVYKVTAGSGTSWTISPVYGGSTDAAAVCSQARFFGLFDTTNTEERNRQYQSVGYEIQQGGPI